jgi:hypothetical protein
MHSYIVDNITFLNKIEALEYASKKRKNVEWQWKNLDIGNHNWQVASSKTLIDLYKDRALEIRDRHNYLILYFSGGADSQNVLNTFIQNKIKLDEIVVSYPASGLQNFTSTDANVDPENNLSEFKFTILPVIETLKLTNPEIKITIHDYYIDMLDYKSMDWIYKSSDWIHPATYAKFNLNRYEHIKIRLATGTVGVIYGLEKPLLYKNNNSIYYLLTDIAVNGAVQSIDHPNCVIENFYLTPDIMTKQSHAIIKDMKHKILTLEELRKSNTSAYQSTFIPFIYPDLEPIKFQTKKSTKRFMVESDSWFYSNHVDTKLYNMIMDDFQNLLSSIDPQFFTEKGFKTYYKTFCLENDNIRSC